MYIYVSEYMAEHADSGGEKMQKQNNHNSSCCCAFDIRFRMPESSGLAPSEGSIPRSFGEKCVLASFSGSYNTGKIQAKKLAAYLLFDVLSGH